MTTVRDLVELVRLPAVLTVPGDVLAGAAATGWPYGRRTWALPVASTCLYWAGMALNDYADRDLDASERPERPIPSGRVRPVHALGLAATLTAAGVAAAGLVGGRPALRVAVPLAGAVWAYDLLAKRGPAGPAVMATARGLDVVLGARGDLRRAALPAAVVAGHTVGVTALSRGEVTGARPAVAAGALAGTLCAALAAGLPPAGRPLRSSLVATALAATYALTVGGSQARALGSPDAMTVRRATGAGVRGLIPLQAALVARSGSLVTAVALVAAGPLARRAARVVSPT